MAWQQLATRDTLEEKQNRFRGEIGFISWLVGKNQISTSWKFESISWIRILVGVGVELILNIYRPWKATRKSPKWRKMSSKLPPSSNQSWLAGKFMKIPYTTNSRPLKRKIFWRWGMFFLYWKVMFDESKLLREMSTEQFKFNYININDIDYLNGMKWQSPISPGIIHMWILIQDINNNT